MNPSPQLTNIDLWRTQLGLLPVPLFSDQEQEQSFVLLNGLYGNFCLDFGSSRVSDETRNFAWSSNVGHYVALFGDYVEVQRWDQKRAVVERYSSKSVYNNLEEFHAYLEKDSPRQEVSIVSHAIQVFRKLRATLGNDFNGFDSLKAFLYLLACVTDRAERGQLELGNWGLSAETVKIGGYINEADWSTLQYELINGRPIESLVPNFALLLRHASGQLFQEAHYEAIFIPQNQLRFGGFLPSPVKISKNYEGIGLHFTPPALVRTLVEESLATLDQPSQSIVIFDPACGSWEFLREALRQLKLSRYRGRVKIIGWDISEAACDTAKFVLAWEKRNSPVRVTVQIHCVDSLSSNIDWPENVDLVLMNPPFLSWQNMDSHQRKAISNALGNLIGQRPDLSHVFLWKASSCLRPGGVLGAVLPASLLDSNSAEKLRKQISDQMSPKLIARLGSHLLFSGVMVDTAFYVAKKGTTTEDPTVAFWADHRSTSSSAGLRTLRKIRYLQSSSVYPVFKEGFSIYLNPTLGYDSNSWSPRPYSSWKLLQSLYHLPKVKDLFDVKQGIRTGHNRTFILKKSQWTKLPEVEKQYFRPAVVNNSIIHGFLKDIAYVFYPYGDYEIEDEHHLQEILREYYNNYLLPAREMLLKRPGIKQERWWELTRHRTWQVEPAPKLVSTYFGDAGSFAWNAEGDFVVVQGFSWVPKLAKRSKPFSEKIGLAYLAILNSPIFSELLSSVSNHVGGGQWNLSKKFVDNIAMPNLFSEQVNPNLIIELSSFGALIHAGLPIDNQSLEQLLNLVYDLEENL